jgi:hypothetical protein
MPLTQGVFCKRYFHEFKKTYGSRNTPREDKVEELKRLILEQRHAPHAEGSRPGVPADLHHGHHDRRRHDRHRRIAAAVSRPRWRHPRGAADGRPVVLGRQHIATLRRLVGEAKAIPYAHMLFEELQSTDQKYVVMGTAQAALRGVQDFLSARGITSVLVNGETPERHRAPLIEAFQQDPRVRVFLRQHQDHGDGDLADGGLQSRHARKRLGAGEQRASPDACARHLADPQHHGPLHHPGQVDRRGRQQNCRG